MNIDYKIDGNVIETDRLLLRAFRESDLDDFFEYASRPGVGEMAGWAHHESKDESYKVLSTFIKEDKTFAICLKETSKVIGSIGVEKYGPESEYPFLKDLRGRELGFVLSKDYHRQGYMSEAVEALMSYLFDEYDLDFITAGYFTFNTGSKKLQEKLGFKPYKEERVKTRMGTIEDGVVNIIFNPSKEINL